MNYTGLNLDLRTDEEKAKDFKQEEILASSTPVQWIEKTQYRTFPIFNQGFTFTCVANSIAKLMGIALQEKEGEFVNFSRSHLYQRRANKPAPGMNGNDAFNIARQGITLEELAPFQDSDLKIDSLKIQDYKNKVGEVFKISNYLEIKPDIEQIASTIQATNKGVMLFFYFHSDEWSQKVPQIKREINLGANDTLRHAVAAVDFTLYQGKKALVIEDSAHFGGLNQRIITEDFMKRCYYAGYMINFKFENIETKPTYIEGNIKSLQDCLKHYGTFPSNTESTSFMGNITWRAVRNFQVKEGLHPIGVNNIGPATIKRLKELYS